MLVEYPEQFLISCVKLPCHILRKPLLVWIEVFLPLLELELRLGHALAYDLALPGERKHIHVEFGYHHLHTAGSQGVDGVLDVLGLREVQTPVGLDSDTVYPDAFRLEPLDHGDDTVHMTFPPDIEVIVIELCVREILLGEPEGVADDFITVSAEGLHPALVTVFSLLTYDFVYHVPGIDPAGISPGDGLYVAAHGFDEFSLAFRLAVLPEPEEVRGLVVPYQGMAEHPEVVFLCKIEVAVGKLEVPYVRPRVQAFRLEAVARREGVEVLEYQFD